MHVIRNLDHRMKLIPKAHQDDTGFHFDREPEDNWVNDVGALEAYRANLRRRRVRYVGMMLIVLLSGVIGHWFFGK